MRMPGQYFWKGLLVALGVLGMDQATKAWMIYGLNLNDIGSVNILPVLSFTMVWNRGISMGLPIEALTGANGLILLTSVITLALLVWLYRTVRRFEALALMLIIGGAAGNLIDRFIYGAVVDFIHLHAGDYSFYVFNVADAAITFGVIALLIDGFFERPKANESQAEGR